MTTREQIIATAKECFDCLADGRGRTDYSADEHGIEKFYAIAFEAGRVAEREEIESLRQQLAERETRLEEKTAECLSFYNEAETVIKQRDEARQQLANSQKREVMLRGYCEKIAFSRIGKCIDLAQELFNREKWATEALAATADIDGLILCEKKPVAFLNPYGGVLHTLTTGLEKSTFTTPLYRAWEPTK